MRDIGRYFAFWPMPRGRANRCIDAGDAARKALKWHEAAVHYRKALAIQPDRRPIWVQLGHAEKEAGKPEAALEAYFRASQLPGDNGEGAFYHGLQARAMGFYVLAKRSLEKAFCEAPADPSVRSEWQSILHEPLAASDVDKAAAVNLVHVERVRLQAYPAPQGDEHTFLIFDATDLLRHFRHSRVLTGIQKVQMEVICAAIFEGVRLKICYFIGKECGWILIPVVQFQSLCALCLTNSDMFQDQWMREVEMLAASVSLAESVQFASGDVLLNLGTSWSLPNYFLHVRQARRQYGIRYVPFVHDLIPVFAPEYCLPDVVKDFLAWIQNVFAHADLFLTNSSMTAKELKHVASLSGSPLSENNVRVTRLNATRQYNETASFAKATLDHFGLASRDFVLFVSSIEPRKNHMMAFRAWQAMITDRACGIPDLVCVGNGGWLNEPVHAMLRDDSALAAKVRILSGISDSDLAVLYKHCRFTIYPSHYEGWGMPITESLGHGKVPIVTRCSSLTEAGGDFAIYVEPNDAEGLARVVKNLWQDADVLVELEDRIRQDFRPHSWRDVAIQIVNACKF